MGDRPPTSGSSGLTVRPTPSRADSDVPLSPSRGDAWTLPGLRTTMRPMPTIIQPPASMLVTRRPTAVVEPEVRHGVDVRVSGEVLSGVTATATGPAPETELTVRKPRPKSKKSRATEALPTVDEAPTPTGPTFTPSPEVERTESRTTDFSPTPVVPRPIAPRPVGQMPSIAEVRSAVSLRAPEPPQPKRPPIPEALASDELSPENPRISRRMKWDDLIAATEPPPEPTPEPSPSRRRGNVPPISMGATPATPAAAPPPAAGATPAAPAEPWPGGAPVSPTAGRTNSLPDLSAFGIIPGVTTGPGATPPTPPPAPRPAAARPAATDGPAPLRARRSRGAITPDDAGPGSTEASAPAASAAPASPAPASPAPAAEPAAPKPAKGRTTPAPGSTPATSAPLLRSRDDAPFLPAGHTHDDGHDHGPALPTGSATAPSTGPSAPADPTRPLTSAEPLLRGRETDSTDSPTSPTRPDLVTHRAEDSSGAAASGQSDATTRVDLASDIRASIESEVGSSPASVEVRQGPQADRKAREFNAEAFTDAGVVHLAADRPLSSARGRQLIAHEATHVVQQSSGTTASRDRLEQQARRVESSAGGPAAPAAPTAAPTRAFTGASTGASAGVSAGAPLAASAPVGAPALSSRTSSPAAAAAGPMPSAHVTVPSPAPRRTPALVGSRPEVQSRPRPGTTSSVPATTSFPDGNRVTIPSAPGQEPADLKVAQQPTAVAAAVASQVAREAIGLSPANAAPLLRPRTDDVELRDRAEARRAAEGEQETSFTEPAPAEPASKPAATPARKTGPSGGGHENEFGQEEADCSCSGETRDTAHDRAWLETHAHALYPFIRAEIRSELLRDRERRGRLMREQR